MTSALPIAAGIGIEGIIWLIILIFWGIAQAIQKSSRRPGRGTPAAPSTPRRPPTPFDDELREMLEQLSGRTATPARAEVVEELEAEEEEIAPAPPPPPRPQRPPPPPPRRTSRPPARPAIRPRPTHAPPAPIPAPSHVQPHPEPEAMTEMAAMISAEDFAAASASLRSGLNSPGLSMRMKGMSLQGMATMPSGNPAGRQGAPF